MDILIIGLGSIAKKHIEAINNINSNCNLFALRSKWTTENYLNVKNIFSLKELSKKPDFILISNPTSKHYKILKDVYYLNCNLFIEKPLVHNLYSLNKINNLYKNYNSTTYIACNLRFLDSLKFIKDYLSKSTSKINEVNIYCGSYLPQWRSNIDYKENYSAQKKLGGGVELDLFHEMDYCIWLLGMPNKINKELRSVSTLDISSNDYANYLLNYQSFSASIILNYYRRDAKRTCEIIFDDKTILIDLLTNSVWENGQLIFESKQKVTDTYGKQMAYFFDTLKNKKDSNNSMQHSSEILKLSL